MPEMGEKVRFRPSAFIERDTPKLPQAVTGTVFYINNPHRYYAVEYELYGVKLRECFKF